MMFKAVFARCLHVFFPEKSAWLFEELGGYLSCRWEIPAFIPTETDLNPVMFTPWFNPS